MEPMKDEMADGKAGDHVPSTAVCNAKRRFSGKSQLCKKVLAALDVYSMHLLEPSQHACAKESDLYPTYMKY